MSVENLQSLMRIRMNGPELRMFNAEKYAKLWVKSGKQRTNDSMRKRQKLNPVINEHMNDDNLVAESSRDSSLF